MQYRTYSYNEAAIVALGVGRPDGEGRPGGGAFFPHTAAYWALRAGEHTVTGNHAAARECLREAERALKAARKALRQATRAK